MLEKTYIKHSYLENMIGTGYLPPKKKVIGITNTILNVLTCIGNPYLCVLSGFLDYYYCWCIHGLITTVSRAFSAAIKICSLYIRYRCDSSTSDCFFIFSSRKFCKIGPWLDIPVIVYIKLSKHTPVFTCDFLCESKLQFLPFWQLATAGHSSLIKLIRSAIFSSVMIFMVTL